MLHWVDDLPGVMAQIRRLLKPDGLCLVNLLGGATLTELRASLLEAEQEIYGGAWPRTAPMADIRDVGGLLGRVGLALPVADADRLTITYPDMFRLMADLRGMGEQKKQNRNTVTEWAKGYPELEVTTGHATFLAWIESYNQKDLSERFVRQGVRLSPGTAFGSDTATRLNFGTNPVTLGDALRRMDTALL